MFNSLTGTVTGKFPQKLLLDTNGIEWDVTVPDTSLDLFPPVGSQAQIFVWLQHTESFMSLFGFASESDRSLFFDLMKVDGIGPKGAVKIMGNISSSALIRLLDEGDVDSLKKVPGVGAKTAGKIMLQLKGKLSFVSDEVVVTKKSNPYSDVVSALVNMGYDRKRAEEAIAKIASDFQSDAEFATFDQTQKEDAVFKKAIRELVQ